MGVCRLCGLGGPEGCEVRLRLSRRTTELGIARRRLRRRSKSGRGECCGVEVNLLAWSGAETAEVRFVYGDE